MGAFDKNNADEGKDAIKRGDVAAALEAASREAASRDNKESLSGDRKPGGLDSFKR